MSSAVGVNEDNYDTLKIVQKILDDAMSGLYKDFNAFRLIKGDGTRKDPSHVTEEIGWRQLAFDVLSPAVEAVRSAVEAIDNKNKR